MTLSKPGLPGTPLDRPIRLAVLISGGGTTLDNLVTHIESGSLNAEVGIVIASKHECGGVRKSIDYGFRTEVAARKDFDSVDTFSNRIFDWCRESTIDLVILGGYLCLLKIPDDFDSRVMNIHPSLIPAFCGKGFHGGRVHQAAYERGVKISGCTVHFADNEYDHGPIILQRTVAISAEDSPDDIARKVFEEECQAFPEAIRLFAEGRLMLEGGKVVVSS